jgi:AcrR family transcriptional regulator
LLQAAEKTTYRQGFAAASIADIAKEARIPSGNVYYHFKTKDEMGGAIVELRVARFRKLLAEWNQLDSPKDRLCAYVQIKIKNRERLARHGCPVGTLCSELQKYGGPAATKSRVLFAEALAWMETQFRELGKAEDSRALALHLLSATQGASLLAHVFHDASLVATEAVRLKAWIHRL